MFVKKLLGESSRRNSSSPRNSISSSTPQSSPAPSPRASLRSSPKGSPKSQGSANGTKDENVSILAADGKLELNTMIDSAGPNYSESDSDDDVGQQAFFVRNLDTGEMEKMTLQDMLNINSDSMGEMRTSSPEDQVQTESKSGETQDESKAEKGERKTSELSVPLGHRMFAMILRSIVVRRYRWKVARAFERLHTLVLLEHETQKLAEEISAKTAECEMLLHENVALRVEHAHDQEAAQEAARAIAEARGTTSADRSITKPVTAVAAVEAAAKTEEEGKLSQKESTTLSGEVEPASSPQKEESGPSKTDANDSIQVRTEVNSEKTFTLEEVAALLKEKGVDPALVLGGDATSVKTVTLADDPVYGKYFKMMSVKVPRMAIENKMRAEGLDPSVLDRDPNSPSPNQPVSPAAASAAASDQSETKALTMKEEPNYGPFFKMLLVGVPRPAVEIKLVEKGLLPKYLDMNPDDPVPSELAPQQQVSVVDGGGDRPAPKFKDDPDYGPFFKMLAVKVPRPAVEMKMNQKGLDPKYLDVDPDGPTPKEILDQRSPPPVAVVKLKDDPVYAPFFKMLAVKVPKQAVMNKMTEKGLDPGVLDMDPEGPAPKPAAEGGKGETAPVMKLKDDPVFLPFFKMLDVKVPKQAVMNKMAQQGLDPAVLDMDPEGPSPNAAKNDESGPVVLLKDDPVYGQYFRMLSVKVPRGAVEAKMRQNNLDPAILDLGPDAPAPKSDKGASNEAGVSGIKLKDHPDYVPFFKMLAVKVPRGAVEAKMRSKNLDPKYLDMDPETTIIPQEKKENIAAAAGPVVKLKDDERYGPFIKMLAVKVPRGAVEAKMVAKGLDPKYLDMDPESPAPPVEGKGGGAAGGPKMVKLKDDERFAPFFKMLSVKVPRGAVEAKMRTKGLDPKYLDMDPESMIPAAADETQEQAVALKDDERYGPFFKMLAVKVPRGAVDAKMRSKGLDPKYLDMDPNSPAPPKEGGSGSQPGVAPPKPPKAPEKKPDKIVRRKLHWRKVNNQSLDKSEAAVWNKCKTFVFEQRELKELNAFFTVNVSEQERQKAREKAERAKANGGVEETKKVKKVKEEKKQLLETQRSNNIAIVLSRMKGLGVDSALIKRCLFKLNIPEEVNVEDVRSVLGLAPTPEEEKILSGYDGDVELLGKAEQYFLELMSIPRYKQRTKCLLYRMKFDEAFEDARADFEAIGKACKDVLESKKFRRLLEIILALGNFMNEGEEVPKTRLAAGFHLDGLAKLKDVRSFTTNPSTTALHYLVWLVQSRERDILTFIKSDTDSIREASNVSLTNASSQLQLLEIGLKIIENEHKHWAGVVSDEVKEKNMTEDDRYFVLQLDLFFKICKDSIKDLRALATSTESSFKETLEYLVEDSSVTSEVLFRTLHSFFVDFQNALNDTTQQSSKKRRERRRRDAIQPGEKKETDGAQEGKGSSSSSSAKSKTAAPKGRSSRASSASSTGSTNKTVKKVVKSAAVDQGHTPGASQNTST